MDNVNRPTKTFMVLPGMKPSYTTDRNKPGEKRLPGFAWLPNRVRNMLICMLGEFVGTYLFLFFAFAATQVANTQLGGTGTLPNISTLLYISLAFGFSLAVNVWIFFRISGGLFNPAVSVALALIGAVTWLKAALLILSQILAGIAAAGIVSALFPGNLAVRTRLGPDTSIVRGLFIEMLLTAELIFCIFMLAAEKHKATFLAPIGIGLALFIAELAGVFFTGGSLNPARSFGPDVVLGSFDGYHWIYWLGPLLGALLAVIFYRLIKILEYETANPGADSDGQEWQYADEPSEDHRRPTGRTDGTDENELMPPIHLANLPLHHQRPASQPHRSNTFTAPGTSVMQASTPSIPIKSAPISSMPAHGMDGHRSRTSIDHPNERPRAQHRRSSELSRSRSRNIGRESDGSYNRGPSLETGTSSNTSSTESSH